MRSVLCGLLLIAVTTALAVDTELIGSKEGERVVISLSISLPLLCVIFIVPLLF